MSGKQVVTGWFILATVVIWIIYDFVAVSVWGNYATESVVLLKLAHQFPIIVFALGCLMGHFFASQTIAGQKEAGLPDEPAVMGSSHPVSARIITEEFQQPDGITWYKHPPLTAPQGMRYEVGPSPKLPDAWNVDAIDHAGEGAIFTAVFMGHDAKGRAEQYATWKNAESELWHGTP